MDTTFDDKVIAAEGEELVALLCSDEATEACKSGRAGYWGIDLLIRTMKQDKPEHSVVWAKKVQLSIKLDRVSRRDSADSLISDEQLDLWEENVSNKGYSVAADFLRPLAPELRPTAVLEANTRMGLQPGWNFSGAVWQAVKDMGQGRTPCLDEANLLRLACRADQIR